MLTPVDQRGFGGRFQREATAEEVGAAGKLAGPIRLSIISDRVRKAKEAMQSEEGAASGSLFAKSEVSGSVDPEASPSDVNQSSGGAPREGLSEGLSSQSDRTLDVGQSNTQAASAPPPASSKTKKKRQNRTSKAPKA